MHQHDYHTPIAESKNLPIRATATTYYLRRQRNRLLVQPPRHSQADVRVSGVVHHVEDCLSGRQVIIPPGEPCGQTCADILCGDHGDVLERGDVLEVNVEEHHHLHPIGVDAAPVGHEENTATTEVALDLRGTRLVPKHLLRNWCEVGELLLAFLLPPRPYVLGIQLHNTDNTNGGDFFSAGQRKSVTAKYKYEDTKYRYSFA